MAKPYSLRKCQSIARTAETSFKRLQKRLSSELLHTFEESLDALEQAIREKDLTNSRILAFKVEDFLAQHAKKSLFEHAREFVFAVIFALIIATIVRMMWFELYEIPSGSMRPTFLESDRVLVFKDDFCVNIPLETAHFLFQPEYVHRGTIIVLTGDKLDLPDVDTVYFGLFPGNGATSSAAQPRMAIRSTFTAASSTASTKMAKRWMRGSPSSFPIWNTSPSSTLKAR